MVYGRQFLLSYVGTEATQKGRFDSGWAYFSSNFLYSQTNQYDPSSAWTTKLHRHLRFASISVASSTAAARIWFQKDPPMPSFYAMCHRVSIELDIFLDFLCSASLPLSACERTDLLEQLWPLLDGSLTPSPTPAVVVAPRAPTPAPAIQPLTVWQLSENGSPSAFPHPRAIPVKETVHFKFAAHGNILATVPRSLIWSLSPRPFQESSVTRLRPLVSCVSVLRVPIYHEYYPPPPFLWPFGRKANRTAASLTITDDHITFDLTSLRLWVYGAFGFTGTDRRRLSFQLRRTQLNYGRCSSPTITPPVRTAAFDSNQAHEYHNAALGRACIDGVFQRAFSGAAEILLPPSNKGLPLCVVAFYDDQKEWLPGRLISRRPCFDSDTSHEPGNEPRGAVYRRPNSTVATKFCVWFDDGDHDYFDLSELRVAQHGTSNAPGEPVPEATAASLPLYEHAFCAVDSHGNSDTAPLRVVVFYDDLNKWLPGRMLHQVRATEEPRPRTNPFLHSPHPFWSVLCACGWPHA